MMMCGLSESIAFFLGKNLSFFHPSCSHDIHLHDLVNVVFCSDMMQVFLLFSSLEAIPGENMPNSEFVIQNPVAATEFCGVINRAKTVGF